MKKKAVIFTLIVIILISGCSSSTGYEVNEANYTVVDYIFMWENYTDKDYKDKNVAFTGEIDYISSRHITINEGLSGITGMLHITPSNRRILNDFSVGNKVTVFGKVKQKLMGYLYIEDAIIRIATRDEIEQTNQNEFDRFIAELDVAAEYEKTAVAVDYDSLVRRPDNYSGQIIKVTGRVEQIMGEGSWILKSGYRFLEDSSFDKEWFIYYDLPDGDPRILEGDVLTFFGEFNGIEKFSRALGGDVYIPTLRARYVY